MAFGTRFLVQKPVSIVQYARLVHWCNYKQRNRLPVIQDGSFWYFVLSTYSTTDAYIYDV